MLLRDGRQLWAGDGTQRGTVPLQRFSGGEGRGVPDAVVQGNRLYFVAETRQGQELWVSDGTADGTRALTAFVLREAFGFFNSPDDFLYLPRQPGVASGFVFLADDGVHGVEPWITDGTPQGTRLIQDVCRGICPSAPELGPVLGGRLYFSAESRDSGRELWSTDGALTRLRDICPGECSSSPGSIFVVGGRLLFAAVDPQYGGELWTSDGTAAGTVRISGDLTAEVGGVLFYIAVAAPWRTDGTAAGTFRLTEEPGYCCVDQEIQAVGSTVFFNFRSLSSDNELWASDGTVAGTRLVRAILPDEPGGSEPESLTAFQERLFFTEVDRDASLQIVFQGRLYYVAEGTLWVTDGTEAGTGPFLDRDGHPIFYPNRFAMLDGRLVFTAWDVFSTTLWESDGTPAGTFPIEPRVEASPYDLAGAGDRVFFSAWDPATGWELWAVRP